MTQQQALEIYLAARNHLAEPLPPFDLVHLCEAMARFAASNSLGFFADPLLEARLAEIAVQPQAASRQVRGPVLHRRVLHYVTRTYKVGGHSRLLGHWINLDSDRRHDLVLRELSEMPRLLSGALLHNDGNCHVLASLVGDNPLTQAETLHRLAGNYDLVILHAHPHDAVPILAFGAGAPCPVIVNNHADHSFWLGSGLGDMVLCSRAEAVELCTERRGIAQERCAFQPWPLPDLEARPVFADRANVRASLGLAPRTEIVLTMAHTWKFMSENGAFFTAFEQFLETRVNTVLCVVGAEPGLLGRTPGAGRILFPGPVEQAELLYMISDVFVDSYPVFTGLATLEAFAHGLPVLSTDLSEVIPGRPRVDQPGLPRSLFHYQERNDFFAALERLLDSPEDRQAQRARLSVPFNTLHAPATVQRGLNTLYRLASDRYFRTLFGPSWRADPHLDIRITDMTLFYQEVFTLAGLAESRLDLPLHLAGTLAV